MLFLSVRGFSDYAGPKQPLAICAAAVLPSSYSEWSRHPDLRAFRSSIAPPTDASVYASRNTSRCPPQDSRSGWIRYFLSCRALASPTTCRFSPAHSGLPALGDLNGDGLPDLLFGNTFSGVITMLNTGVASLAPTSPLAFPAQLVNTKSSSQTVTLTNNGKSALSISSIKVSGEFKESSTCGKSLAAGAQCTVSSLFQPTTTGSLTGLITLVDSASSKPQFIELLGAGTAIKLSAGSLNFGSQKVGTKSKSQIVSATNEGSTAVQFSSVYIGGADSRDFLETNTCTAQAIQPGASCTATVTFDPTKTGTRSASLYLRVKNRPGAGPQPVTLTGTGI